MDARSSAFAACCGARPTRTKPPCFCLSARESPSRSRPASSGRHTFRGRGRGRLRVRLRVRVRSRVRPHLPSDHGALDRLELHGALVGVGGRVRLGVRG